MAPEAEEKTALRLVRLASTDVAKALRKAGPMAGLELDRGRVVVARSRISAVPASAPIRVARGLDRVANSRTKTVRRGLQLVFLAERNQNKCRELLRKHRLRGSLSDAQRRSLLSGRRPTKAHLDFLAEVGIGVAPLLKLNDQAIQRALARLTDQLKDVVRLRVTAELSLFAGKERQQASNQTSLSDIATVASNAGEAIHTRLHSLNRLLRDRSARDTKVATEASALAREGQNAARKLAPLAIGLHRWAKPGPGVLRFRKDHIAASLAVASALHAALLGYAVGLYLTESFGAGLAALCQPWRSTARSLRSNNYSLLDRAGQAHGVTGSARRVRGIVQAIHQIQVTKQKRIAILRVRQGPRSACTVVVPFFNPIYVGIQVGTCVDVWAHWTRDVLDEFVNRNTLRRLNSLSQKFGGPEGGVIDRLDLGSIAKSQWTAWLVKEVRPMYNALPNSINGIWSLGNTFALSVASGTAN